VDVEHIDATLQVTVRYVELSEGTPQQATFVVPGGGA
jgi:hypothetical protein